MTDRDKYIMNLLEQDCATLRQNISTVSAVASAMRTLGIGNSEENVFDDISAGLSMMLSQFEWRNREIQQYFSDRIFANSHEFEQIGWIIRNRFGEERYRPMQKGVSGISSPDGKAPETYKGESVFPCFTVMK